eukprot:TRINITY_DN1369_c0_g3_i1.p1 TRINITY_DN1369_c0_g3~~TRINITY_DN1369_c0_g3_i1.p1  ORF type:complete len:392 (-),score=130.49 TRINITY_DN1369_c0_g3_i1:21-1196(-)
MLQLPLPLLLRCILLSVATVLVAADHYEVLGVDRSATADQIKKAYRKLSLRYHPDKNPNSKEAADMFVKVTSAYATLNDPDKRVMYDQWGDNPPRHNHGYHQQQGGFGGFRGGRGGGHRPAASADFYTGTDIKTLSESLLLNLKRPLLADFYAPWCSHCREMVDAFKRAALLLDGVADLAAVNCDREGYFCQQHNVHGYPTIRLYRPTERGHYEAEDYEGPHDAEAFVRFVKGSLVTNLVELNADTFPRLVLDETQRWFVDFSAGAWCGPCTQTKPAMRAMSNALLGVVNVGIINCNDYPDVCSRYNVNSYPTFRMFGLGANKGEGTHLEFNHMQFVQTSVLQLITQTILSVVPPPPPPPPPVEAFDDVEPDMCFDPSCGDENFPENHDEL